MRRFSLSSLLSDFNSGEISHDELEDIIKEAVRKETEMGIDSFDYTEDGLTVILSDGNIIEIEIDWQEIVLGK